MIYNLTGNMATQQMGGGMQVQMPGGGSGMTAAQAQQLAKNTENIRKLSEEIADLDGLTYGIYVGDTQPTNGVMYWLDTSGDAGGGEEEPDEPTTPTLTSISATYTGGEAAVGTAVTSLTGITVKATYSDGSTKNVTGYTLSGTIAEGTNTITVSYGGKTTTFTVTGVTESSGDGATIYKLSDIAVETHEGKNATLYTHANYNTYKIINVKAGDVVRIGSSNGDATACLSDGTNHYKLNDTSMFTGVLMDNYAWKQYSWTADKDYEFLYISENYGTLDRYPNSYARLETTTDHSKDKENYQPDIPEEPEVDLSESNVVASTPYSTDNTGAITFRKSSTPTYDDFMALEVDKLYYYFNPSSEYRKAISIGASFTSGWGSESLGTGITIEQATNGTYEYVTNAWDRYADYGYVVFEIDAPKLKAKLQSMYDDGTLDATKDKSVSIRNPVAVTTDSTAYLLYNYSE